MIRRIKPRLGEILLGVLITLFIFYPRPPIDYSNVEPTYDFSTNKLSVKKSVNAGFSLFADPYALQQLLGEKAAFSGTLNSDLIMNNYDIQMGTGQIGFDGSANEGWTFDTSGNITMGTGGSTLNLSNNNTTVGTGWLGRAASAMTFDASEHVVITVNLDIGDNIIYTNNVLTRMDFATANQMKFYCNNTIPMKLVEGYAQFGGSGGSSPSVMSETSTATNSVFNPIADYPTSGIGGVADKPAFIVKGVQSQYNDADVDADSDTDDVLSTALTGVHGYLIVGEGTADESCMYFLSNVTIEKMSSDATFTVTKDNAATYNVYYDTTAFMIQNKVGDNKSIKWVFYGIPIF